MLVLWYGRRGKRGLIVLVGGEALLLLWVLLLLLLMLLLLELGGLGGLSILSRSAGWGLVLTGRWLLRLLGGLKVAKVGVEVMLGKGRLVVHVGWLCRIHQGLRRRLRGLLWMMCRHGQRTLLGGSSSKV